MAARTDADRAKDRAKYAADPERFQAKARATYAANPEKARARRRGYRPADPERFRAKQRAKYAADPTKGRLSSAAYYRRNREKCAAAVRRYGLRRRYGLTSQAYAALLGKQEGRCAVCAQILESGRKRAVDHDHTTGVVRGLLCQHCNLCIGHAQDDPKILGAAMKYLTNASAIGDARRV